MRTTLSGEGSICGDSTPSAWVEAWADSSATRLALPMIASLPPVFVIDL
jgi:hypothetical protein